MTSFNNASCLAIDMLCLHQKRNRFTSRIKRPLYHLWTFSNEHSLFWIGPVQKLVFSQSGIHIQIGIHKICYCDYIVRHIINPPSDVLPWLPHDACCPPGLHNAYVWYLHPCAPEHLPQDRYHLFPDKVWCHTYYEAYEE